MLFTATDIEFTFSQATGLLKIPVRDILLIHIDSTYTNALYFVYTDRLLSIKNRIHNLKYSEIESYNGGDVPEFNDLISAIKTFAPARWLSVPNSKLSQLTDEGISAASANLDLIQFNSVTGKWENHAPPATQIQSDWNQTNNALLDYIKNKPIIYPQIQSDWTQTNIGYLDYIKGKPTIPAAQINSDWNQANSGLLDFIKNKPTIPTQYWQKNTTTLSPLTSGDRLSINGSSTNSSLQMGAMELQSYSISDVWMSNNLYYNGSAMKYRNTSAFLSGLIELSVGKFAFVNAPAGSAGASATLTTRFLVNEEGNGTFGGTLGIGNSAYILPSSAGTSGQALLFPATGATLAWGNPSAGAAGSTTQVQYNNSGVLAGSSSFLWDESSKVLTVSGLLAVNAKAGITADGGFYVDLTNLDNNPIDAGMIVQVYRDGGNNGFKLHVDSIPIGVLYENISDGDAGKVITHGIGYVRMNGDVIVSAGDILYSYYDGSNFDGTATPFTSYGGIQIGICLESTESSGALVKAFIHIINDILYPA